MRFIKGFLSGVFGDVTVRDHAALDDVLVVNRLQGLQALLHEDVSAVLVERELSESVLKAAQSFSDKHREALYRAQANYPFESVQRHMFDPAFKNNLEKLGSKTINTLAGDAEELMSEYLIATNERSATGRLVAEADPDNRWMMERVPFSGNLMMLAAYGESGVLWGGGANGPEYDLEKGQVLVVKGQKHPHVMSGVTQPVHVRIDPHTPMTAAVLRLQVT